MGNPGPNERANNTCAAAMFGDTRDKGCVGRQYMLTEDVPRNAQLVQFYGHSWFESRGIERIDVGTKKFPAPKRRGKKRRSRFERLGIKVDGKKSKTSTNKRDKQSKSNKSSKKNSP